MKILKNLRKPPPTTAHFATGGLSHFLGLLGHSINHALETGRSLVVVSEYHQPLACQPLDEIFHLREPLRPLGEFIQESGREDLLALRPLRFSQERQGQIALVRDKGKTRYHTAYLERESHTYVPAPVTVTTGDWAPGIPAEERPPHNLLSALSSLSIRGVFAEAVHERLRQEKDPFLGVHFRNSDHSSDLESMIRRVKDAIQETGITDIHWCTDDLSSIEQARERLPRAHISSGQVFSRGTKKNLHYSLRGSDSVNHLANTFADIYTLTKAQVFLPSAGSWKKLVPILREKEDVRDNFFNL